MIDAISAYSSTHGGRLKFNNTTQTKDLYKTFGHEYAVLSKKNNRQSPLSSCLVVGGAAAAISMIIETLFSANTLSKGNFSMIGDIVRHAGIMGLLGGACLAVFNVLEKKILDKIA